MRKFLMLTGAATVLAAPLALAQTANPPESPKPLAPAAAPAVPEYKYKTPKLKRADLDALLAKPEQILIIDVRRPDEVTAIGGLPVYLSTQAKDIEKALPYIPKDRAIVTVSNHAGRAGAAADFLADHGYKVAGAVGVQNYEEEGGTLTKITPPWKGELLTVKSLSANQALTVAHVAYETCVEQGYKVSVHVVGREGEVLAALRGDGSSPHTFENSQRKAYTARTFRVPSGEFAQRVKDNPTLGAQHLTGVIALQGALPIKIGEDVIGAVGVSGAPGGDKDEACSKAGIDRIGEQLK